MGVLSELTGKQEAFIAAYIGPANCNATEAARIAGYNANGNSLEVIACNVLRNVKVASRIRQVMRDSAMDPDEVVKRISDCARSSIDDIGNVDGGMFFTDLDKTKKRGKLHTISSIEYSDKGQIKVKMYNALDALEKLAKMHGLYAEEKPHVQNDTKILNVFLDSLHPDAAGAIRQALSGLDQADLPSGSD